MTVIWYCLLNRQAEENIAKCLLQGHNNMTTAEFEPRPYRSKVACVTARSCCGRHNDCTDLLQPQTGALHNTKKCINNNWFTKLLGTTYSELMLQYYTE